MKELVSGELCYAGKYGDKRIWLGCFNGQHLCVRMGQEQLFIMGYQFSADSWSICTPIKEEQEYEYQWLVNGEV